MIDAIAPFETTPQRLRRLASHFTTLRGGAAEKAMREAADEIERMRSCFETLQRAAEREGYDVLINIDGAEISLRRRDDC
jgi:hypothetical protein